jgi:hypothetical protein
MKTMLIILAMLLAGSAFALAPDDPIRKSIEAMTAEASKASPMPSSYQSCQHDSSTPAVVTVMEVNPGVWKASDGSTIRDMGTLGYTISKP